MAAGGILLEGCSEFVMFSNHQLESILAQWPIGRLPIRAIQPVSGGLSGALIWKIETSADSSLSLSTEFKGSTWALKAWPSETSPKRLQLIHNLVAQAAAHCDLLTKPAITVDRGSIVPAHNRLWDCSRWVTGRPLPLEASTHSLESAGEAIASVHHAFSIGNPQQITDVPRSISHRLQRFAELSVELRPMLGSPPTLDAISCELVTQISSPAEECHALAGVLTAAIQHLQVSWPLACSQIHQELQTFAQKRRELPIRCVLRDVHRGHVFAEPAGGRITGVIDYDAIGFDTPSCDVARFAGSFQSAGSDALDLVAAGYRQIQPLTERDYDLAKTLIRANLIGGLANWVVWLVGERRPYHCEALLIRDRISHLIASNCRIC